MTHDFVARLARDLAADPSRLPLWLAMAHTEGTWQRAWTQCGDPAAMLEVLLHTDVRAATLAVCRCVRRVLHRVPAGVMWPRQEASIIEAWARGGRHPGPWSTCRDFSTNPDWAERAMIFARLALDSRDPLEGAGDLRAALAYAKRSASVEMGGDEAAETFADAIRAAVPCPLPTTLAPPKVAHG